MIFEGGGVRIYASFHHKWTYLCRIIPLLFAQLYLGRDQSQIRIKSEVGTFKHIEALQFFFLLAQIWSIVALSVKNLAFTPYTLCVCVGGGGQDVITIRTSIMTPLSATVSRVSTARGVGGGGGGAVVTTAFYSHNACWYMRALYNNENEHRR